MTFCLPSVNSMMTSWLPISAVVGVPANSPVPSPLSVNSTQSGFSNTARSSNCPPPGVMLSTLPSNGSFSNPNRSNRPVNLSALRSTVTSMLIFLVTAWPAESVAVSVSVNVPSLL